jgi:hypothetical protein
MALTFGALHSAAWQKVGIGNRDVPGEIFPKFAKKDFEDLKTDYTNQYGYTVRIPQWDDVVHMTPTEFKTPQEIKAEKKEALTRVLESPAPEWARTYSSVMTWIDNVQDTMSIVYPLLSMLGRVAPKAFGKLIPVIGWIGVGYDLLNIANAIGRAPLTGMKSKRELCVLKKRNPFSKAARIENARKIKNYKAGLSDLIQVAQVLDQFTGAGLCLGGVMGAITDSIFGAYRYLNGEPVRWSFDPPPVENLQMMGARGLKAAAAINSHGEVFSELTHFWSYMTAYCSSMVLAGTFKDEDLTDLVINPADMMIPAPEPKDPNTIAAIEDAGLRVGDGIGWPYNGKKFISVGDYIEATTDPCNANFHAYCSRHYNDSYGLLAAYAMDSLIPQTILAMDPEARYHVDDTDEMKVFWRMIKGPLLPTKPVNKETGERFINWIREYSDQYGKTPGILEIEEKFKMLEIPYTTSYPATPGPGFEEFWPPGWEGTASF